MTAASTDPQSSSDASDADTNEKSSLRVRVLGMLRSFARVAVIGVVVGGIVTAVVMSHFRKQLLRNMSLVGNDFIEQYELNEGKIEESDAERIFVLNGQEIYVRVQHDDRSVDQLLASMPGDCERLDEDDRSHQTCVGDGMSFDMLAGVASGEPPPLDQVKYRMAIGQDDGGSIYLDLTPKAGFDPMSLVADDEDVEGPDHSDIPRPPGARRFMSAYERGRPYLASMFVGSSESPRELKEWYRQNMDPDIWTETELDEDEDTFVVFRRNGAPHRFVALTFRVDDTDGGTLTAITEAQ